MKKLYKFQKFVLLEKMSFLGVIISGIFNFFGYLFGYLFSFPWLNACGMSVSRKIFRIQSASYVENGEKVYRRIDCGPSLVGEFKGMKTIIEIFKNLLKTDPNAPCIGYRRVVKEIYVQVDGKDITQLELLPFQWLTVRQMYDRVISLSVFLNSIGVYRDTKVLLFAETSQDWLITALAVMSLRAIIVTIYPTLKDDAIIHCLKLTMPTVLLVDQKTSNRIEGMISGVSSISAIIYGSRCHTSIADNFHDTLKRIHIDIIYNDPAFCCKELFSGFDEPEPSDLIFIMFTSGSTGMPKGVMIRHSNIVAVVAGCSSQDRIWQKQTYPAYLHLSHILELCSELGIIAHGGKLGYCNPNTLFETGTMLAPGCPGDLSLLKPTCMAVVPLILQRIRALVMDRLDKASTMKKVIFQCSYNLKAHFYQRGLDTPILDRFIFGKFKSIFGGNIQFCVSGGALLPKQTEEFFNICFFPLKQAYGATEICCGATFSNIDYRRPHNVGPVYGSSEVKIIPWEEGGYIMENGEIFKGELLVSGPCVCSGYYKDDISTAKNFILDKVTNKVWYCTSDIVKLKKDGTFKIIGRKSEVVKLSHGEFVELSKVENVISMCKYVDFVCVVTNQDSSQLIAILCINRDAVLQLIKNKVNASQENGKSIEQVVITEKTKLLLISEISKVIAKEKLSKYERPQHFVFIDQPWLPESGLITPTMKVNRIKITQKYYKEIQPY